MQEVNHVADRGQLYHYNALLRQAAQEAINSNLLEAIRLLEIIPKTARQYKDAQHGIGQYKKVLAEQESAEIKNNYPKYNHLVTEQSVALRCLDEAGPHFLAAGDDDSNTAYQALNEMITAPNSQFNDRPHDIEAQLIKGKYVRLKTGKTSVTTPACLLSIPLTIASGVIGATSLYYRARETSYISERDSFWKAFEDMGNNCTFDSKIPFSDPNIDHINSNANIYPAFFSAVSNYFMLAPVFYFAKQYGVSKEKKYLLAAIACAGMSIGAFFTEETIINHFANIDGQTQGYNWGWSNCSIDIEDLCRNSSHCIYTKNSRGFWDDPNLYHNAPHFLKSFFLNWGSLLVTFGCAGAVIVLGVVAGYFSPRPEIIEVNNEVAESRVSNYGSINIPESEESLAPATSMMR